MGVGGTAKTRGAGPLPLPTELVPSRAVIEIGSSPHTHVLINSKHAVADVDVECASLSNRFSSHVEVTAKGRDKVMRGRSVGRGRHNMGGG